MPEVPFQWGQRRDISATKGRNTSGKNISARTEQRLGFGAADEGEMINRPESHLEAGERREVAELAESSQSLGQG